MDREIHSRDFKIFWIFIVFFMLFTLKKLISYEFITVLIPSDWGIFSI